MILEQYIQHSALKPDTTIRDVETVCREAIEHNFTSVCVPPLYVKNAKALTAITDIKVCTVIAYPFGYSAIEAKIAEIVLAVIDGADEIEMVVNTAAVKNNDWQYLAMEINTVLPVIRRKEKKITVIIETALLTDKEVVTACDIYGAAAVDYIRVGTGFIKNGMIIDNLKLIRTHLAAPVQIKAATEINNYSFAKELIKAGANRLCINNGLQLVRESLHQN